MEKDEYIRRFGGLSAEMTEYWDSDEATGTEMDDIALAQRWLIEHDSSLASNASHLRAIIAEARDALSCFDECGERFVDSLNVRRIATPAEARAWIEKMILIWEGILAQVEAKRRENGDSGREAGC